MSTTRARLHDVFDLSMQIGEIMLASGAAAADVTATMLRLTASSGIRDVSVQVTFNELSVSYLPDEEAAPFTRIRAVSGQDLDFAKLDEAERITSQYIQGELSLADASAAAGRLQGAGPLYSRWITTAGWGIMGGAAALGFGASTLVMLFAAIAAAMIHNMFIVLGRAGLPSFFIQMFGGFLSVLMAILAHLIDPSTNSSIVVVACIIMLLAGLTSIGAMQDAITGWYITASARVLEAVMLTIGIVIGVRAGLVFAAWLGVDITVSARLPGTLLSVVMVAVAGAVMGFGYAVGVQMPRRNLAVAALLATFSSVIAFALGQAGVERPWAVGVTAFVAGCFAVAAAPVLRTAVTTLVVGGIIPLMPGSTIYRGLLELSEAPEAGAVTLFTAASIAVSISAGVIFGQFFMVWLMAVGQVASSRFVPVLAAPFATNRRRRMLSSRRRRPAAMTQAIPVVQLEPGETDPTVAARAPSGPIPLPDSSSTDSESAPEGDSR